MLVDPNWLSAGASIAMVAVTGVYVWIAKKSLEASHKAMDQMAEASVMRDRPYITISQVTPPGSVSIFLVIANTGKSAAKHLRMKLDPDFKPFVTSPADFRPLSEVEIFRREVDTFTPGTRMTFQLHSFKVMPPRHLQEHPEMYRFQIHSAYEYAGRSFSEVTQIDLSDWRGGEIEHLPLLDCLNEMKVEMCASKQAIERIAVSLESGSDE